MNPRLLFPLWPKVFCKEGSLCVRSGLFLNHVSAALLRLVNSGLKKMKPGTQGGNQQGFLMCSSESLSVFSP